MKRHPFRLWLTLVLGFGLAATALAQAPPTTSGGSGMALLNLDNTVALHGYDPVAYFTDNEAVKGNKRILERLGGATYYFASGGAAMNSCETPRAISRNSAGIAPPPGHGPAGGHQPPPLCHLRGQALPVQQPRGRGHVYARPSPDHL